MRRTALGLGLTLVSGLVLFKMTNWSTTISVLQRADPTLIGLAVAALVASLAAKTVRWRLLLPQRPQVTTARLYRILHISFLLNNILPARLGDVARVAMTSAQPGLRVGHVVSSLLTERVTDAVMLLVAFVLVSPFLPIPAAYAQWVYLAWFSIGALAATAVLMGVFRSPLRRLWLRLALGGRLPTKRLRDEAASFQEGLGRLYPGRGVLPIWGLSGVAWLGAFALNYLLMRALGITAPFTVAVLLTCTTNLAMLIPSSPGYIGVFHAAATLTLLPFGVGSSLALSFAILAHLVNVLPVCIIGGIFLLWGRETMSLDIGALRRNRLEQAVESDAV
ncbi:MAG TPA: lysylphosphatidylglycerol synthase transmembrane domain-containing protein [Tepidiformaceae bacterium]